MRYSTCFMMFDQIRIKTLKIKNLKFQNTIRDSSARRSACPSAPKGTENEGSLFPGSESSNHQRT